MEWYFHWQTIYFILIVNFDCGIYHRQVTAMSIMTTEENALELFTTVPVLSTSNVTEYEQSTTGSQSNGSVDTHNSADSASSVSTTKRFSTPACELYNFIVYVIIYGLLSLLGIVCNMMSLIVLWPDWRKSASIQLLLLLAVADTLVLISWSTLLTLPIAVRFRGKWWPAYTDYYYHYMRKFAWVPANMLQMASGWYIVIITVQRYVAVCLPYNVQKYGSVKVAWIEVAIVTVISIVFNLPRFFEFDIISTSQPGAVRAIKNDMGASNSYNLYYKSVTYYLLSYAIPLIILSYLTVALIRQLRKNGNQVVPSSQGASTAITSVSQSSHSQSKQRKVAWMNSSKHDDCVLEETAETSARITTQDVSNQDTGCVSAQQPQPQQKKKALGNKEDVTFALVVVVIVFMICQLPNPLRRVVELFLDPVDMLCGTPYFYFAPLTGLGVFINASVNFVIFCICGKGFRDIAKQRLCNNRCGAGVTRIWSLIRNAWNR